MKSGRCNLVIVGGGGHAKVIACIAEKTDMYSIIGYTDPVNRGQLFDIPYLGDDSVLSNLICDYPDCCAVIAVGFNKHGDLNLRKNLSDHVSSIGYELNSVISPDAVINRDVIIGEGTVIMDGAVINTGTVIEDNVIINTNCSIDHDCHIASASHIAPGATLCGNVKLGRNVLIGAGATIIPGVEVGNDVIIGAGAVVTDNCTEGLYTGLPARSVV